MVSLVAAEGGAGAYLDWGVVHISIANLLIILLMIVVFFAVLLIPFPKPPSERATDPPRGADRAGWTDELHDVDRACAGADRAHRPARRGAS